MPTDFIPETNACCVNFNVNSAELRFTQLSPFFSHQGVELVQILVHLQKLLKFNQLNIIFFGHTKTILKKRSTLIGKY